jgi:hypothetical protein
LTRLRVLVGVCVILLGLAACEGGDVPAAPAMADKSPLPSWAGGEPTLDQNIVSAADVRATAQPLDAYLTSDEAARLISRARIVVGNKCMGRFGFQPVPGWIATGAPTTLSESRYGLWDAAWASTHGYEPQPLDDGNKTPVRFEGNEAINIYFGGTKVYHGIGVPDGGCQGEEIRTIAENVPQIDAHYIDDLRKEALTRATQDSRVVPLMGKWHDCMKAAGWDYPDVISPFSHWSTRRGDDKFQSVVSQDELDGARDDLLCKKSTALLGTWLGADMAYQKAIIDREGEKLREYAAAVDKIVESAKRIISQG